MAPIPERIAKYEVIRRLGHGGMGTVYLARDPDLDRLLAIKVLRDVLYEDELIQRFLREARASGNLRHENIITVYDAGQHDHQPFMAMEYVDGVSMAEMIRARQPLSLADKLSYLEQICAGLYYAHGRGIVHRDIKPANLMVDRRNIVRILDFGIARVEGSGMTRDGSMMGTLNYMSPEQMLGKPVDHRSDIFAFGAVAYELLAYERAFPGTIEDGLLHRLPNEPPRALSELCPGLPDAIEPLVMRALAKQAHERFEDLQEARAALRQIRRELDPELDLEPITPARPGRAPGAGLTPTPGHTAERSELFERRARQIAYHRDAARAAFAAQDLDGAIAACEDALMLDPDDQEAAQLLAELQRARDAQGAQSKERRERERTVRRRLADADLKLSKGDVASAADLIQQALTLDPGNSAALALRSRIEAAAGSPTIVAPTVVRPRSAARPASADDPTTETPLPPAAVSPATVAPQPAPPTRRLALIGAGVAAVVIGGVIWFSTADDRSEPAGPATATRVDPAPTPAPAPEAVPPPAADPRPVPPTVADANVSLDDQLRHITETYRRGDLNGALSELRPVLARTNDDRARTLARTIATDARRSMTAAAASARSQKAAEQSPTLFASAERARAQSERAVGRNDFVEAGTQALLAATNYSLAEREAVAAIAKTPAPARPRENADAAPPPPVVQPPPAVTPSVAAANPAAVPTPTPTSTPAPAIAPAPPPAAAPPNAANTAAPPAAPSVLDVEGPAMLLAISRYQNAYRDRSVKALKAVYPNLPPEMEQRLERTFRDCRSYDFDYLNPRLAFTAGDPTSGTINAQTSYTCQPRSAQKPETVSSQEVFMLRKVGGSWLIENAIMAAPTRR